MTQLSLTDDRILDEAVNSTDSDSGDAGPDVTTEHDPSEPSREDFGPVENHPAVQDISIDGMELETNADGWRRFPHPEEITAHLDEDMDADQPSFPSEVREAIDELTDDPDLGEFLVMDAEAVYEYLETLQKQSDLHLENFHRRQLIVNQLSGGRGYAKGASLSTYDKKWICQWEVHRRLAERDFEKWGDETLLSKENRGLPNA